jgi:hypothetical protein
MKFYKILNKDEYHRGLQYHDGLVEDPISWNPSGSCEPGGIYFASKDILAFLDYGPWIREVTIPAGTPIYKDPKLGPEKFKAPQVILGPREKITPEVIKRLVEEGANVNAGQGRALYWAIYDDNLPIVKLLIESGANVNAHQGRALSQAARHGNLSMAKFLVKAGATEGLESAIEEAERWNHTKIAEYLKKVYDEILQNS